MASGLNPFEIRAGQKLSGAYGVGHRWGLNPFEIRAGQKRYSRPFRGFCMCLNPFEIRAGQKRIHGLEDSPEAVLIPLKSGQARNIFAANMKTVMSLNPFEIRAGQKRAKVFH